MARKAQKSVAPAFTAGGHIQFGGTAQVGVVTDDSGRLWRIDIQDGSMRPIGMETKPKKPKRK